MPQEARHYLEEYYREPNEQLETLVKSTVVVDEGVTT